jgi:hypothetical protein
MDRKRKMKRKPQKEKEKGRGRGREMYPQLLDGIFRSDKTVLASRKSFSLKTGSTHALATIRGPSAFCPQESTTSMLFLNSSCVMSPFLTKTRIIDKEVKTKHVEKRWRERGKKMEGKTVRGPSAFCPQESTTSMLFRNSSCVMRPFLTKKQNCRKDGEKEGRKWRGEGKTIRGPSVFYPQEPTTSMLFLNSSCVMRPFLTKTRIIEKKSKQNMWRKDGEKEGRK